MKSTIAAYRTLLAEIDAWFESCLQAAPPGTLSCRKGCSACCRGLFDITLLDAFLLREGFAQLPADVQAQVLARCRPRLAELRQRWPELHPPYLLNSLPDNGWTEMPEGDEIPCPLLGNDGLCLVYSFRPMTCRLHGLPNIDLSGEDFSADLCTLHSGNPHTLPADVLRWHFRETFTREFTLLRAFTLQLTGTPTSEADTFIPLALLVDYGYFVRSEE
ncbi:MAG: YkgJ family cysteine cluster protein [Desulfuromonadales bacterium]|nr:YkgJ family cysteine cluster protein [Desulfuromonadales bacterium]